MKRLRIKLAHQEQANKPIFLMYNGVVECGRFRYRGRYKLRFSKIYGEILDLHVGIRDGDVLDVSRCEFWDAVRIYDEYVVRNWYKTVTAKRLEGFAKETAVFLLVEEIRTEFKRAVGIRWRRVVKNMDSADPDRPKHGWEIL